MEWLKKNKEIVLIVMVFAIMSLIGLSDNVWWDSSVYLSMGKAIFSFGKLGLWEESRPLVWPIILGLVWRLKLDYVLFGKIVSVLFSIGTVVVTYLIGKKLFDKKVGLASAVVLSVFPTFLLFSNKLLSEIPALLFFVLGVYFLISENDLPGGLFFGLCFMTRFFFIVAIVPFLAWNIFREKKINAVMWFATPVVVYLIVNYFIYGDIFRPFFTQLDMTLYTGKVYYEPFYFYFWELLKENFLVFGSIIGGLFLFKEKHNRLFVISSLFILIVFSLASHKEVRLVMMAFPLLAIVSGYGISKIGNIFKRKWITLAIVFLGVVYGLSMFNFSSSTNEFKEINVRLSDAPGMIWITNPKYIVNTDLKAEPIYYPRIDPEKISELENEVGNVDYIVLSKCDLLCQPYDPECEKRLSEFYESLFDTFSIYYQQERGGCDDYILKK